MPKIKRPHKALPVNGPNPNINPKLLLLLIKAAIQLPLAPDLNEPKQEKDLPLKSKETVRRNPQQTKINLRQSVLIKLPLIPQQPRLHHTQGGRLKLFQM